MNRKLTSLVLDLIFVGLLMAGCGTATTVTPAATRPASASPAPSATPSALPSATPTSAPVKPTATVPAPTPVPTLPPLPQTTASNLCPGTQPSLLMPGRQGRVSTASAATNRVRSEPSTAGAIMGEIPAGEYFDVLAGPACANGLAWFQVRTKKLEGWMAEGSADEYWVQPILTDAQNVSGPNIELPGFEFVLPEAVGSKMRVSNLPYDPETRTPPVSLAQFADYPLPNANAVIYVYPVEDYLYYRSDQRAALEQLRTAINTLLTNPFSQVSLPSVTDALQWDDVTLTQAGAFKAGLGLRAVARLSPTDGSAAPKAYYVFFGYSSDMKYLILAKLDVKLNVGQLAQASTTDFTPSLSLLDEIFKLDLPDKCEVAAFSSDNLAYQKPARASASFQYPPAHAVDENNSTQWGAGSHPPQWIEIDLGQIYHITEIRLMVEQWPEGDTVHHIQGRSVDGAFVHLHTFRQKTSGCDWLIFTPEPPIAGIQIIRIDTLSSPSWVAWREIQVYGEATPSATPVLPTATAVVAQPTPSGPPIAHLTAGQPIIITTIHMSDATSGWALGNNHVLRTADGGLTWRDVTPAKGTGRAAFMDANTAWVFGSITSLPGGLTRTATVWRTQDAGQTWMSSSPIDTTTTIGDYFLLSDLVFVDAQTGWLLAHVAGFMMQDFVIVFTTSDGGQTWERIVDVDQAHRTFSFACDKTGLVFVDEKTGWITGNCNGIGSGAPLFQKTTDGGRTWQGVEWPPPDSAADLFRQDVGQFVVCGLYAPRFFSPHSGVVVMLCRIYTSDGNAHYSSYLYTTNDGGQTWKSSPIPDHYDTMQFLNPMIGWVMTSKRPGPDVPPDMPHDIYLTKDGGQTWTKVKTVNWSGQLDFINEQEGWAVAKTGDQVALVHTTDGGKTWQELKPQIAP